ncbi:hypothetical protein [Thetidibacter halocola]|uniref:Uncharacterized protein n=1 Tax=Thetidibacter halocola TaxID=2827239 RepID=A0A8J7WBD8_9RHOB|nr:hypothetical protein [Thetidibacter halocola]MBS0124417.1 hypothetical protein [Thetidibacter halocola]
MDVTNGGSAALCCGGKGNGRAVGHMAKAAVAEARAAGAELPANAQGLAASGIARGMDVMAMLAAYGPPPVASPEPTPDLGVDPAEALPATNAPGEEAAVETAEPEAGMASGEAVTGYAASVGILSVTASETALQLLQAV